MTKTHLEHINITVSDPQRTASMLCGLFDWQIRWQGAAKAGGHTIHVGTKEHYIALYSPGKPEPKTGSNYTTVGGFNHVGIVVADLDTAEKKVREAGFEPHSHADYEPGKRFYFNDADGIEFEVVSYEM